MPEPADLPAARHEATDVGLRPLLVGGVGVLVVLLLVGGLTAWLYPGARDRHVVRTDGLPRFPAPELQPSPAADMAVFRTGQLQQLNGVWWVDHAAGTVHQPIADAMRRLAGRGIPDWPTAPVQARPTPQARPAP